MENGRIFSIAKLHFHYRKLRLRVRYSIRIWLLLLTVLCSFLSLVVFFFSSSCLFTRPKVVQSPSTSTAFTMPTTTRDRERRYWISLSLTVIYPTVGFCVMMCDHEYGYTRINCAVGLEIPEENYLRALDINPRNHTIAAAYPDADGKQVPDDHIKDPCINSSLVFSSTQSVSFTLLEDFETFIRCPHSDGPIWDKNHYNQCHKGEYDVYGPYEHGSLLESPPDCLNIQFPILSSEENNFSIHYNISDECKRCQRGRCHINSNVEVYCHHRTRGHLVLKITLVTVIPGSVIILAFLYVCWRRGKNKSGSSTLPSTSRSLSFNRIRTDLEVGSMNGVTVYSYTELEEATNYFDSAKQLGEGGFGVVYHGKLRDGREVAVKRLYEKSYKRIEQFKNEIRILTDLRHQNLVTLYGCTSRHTRELLLVYEYIPNGTVADHLHGEKTKSRLLPWPTRMSIAIETATALSYLHYKDIIHRDVKTNNILLDNNFSVKVADFGLSRLFPADVTHVSTAPQGTPGYVDPEYHQCYHLTNKSDVYSFGVVLIELISSLLAVDVGRDRHEINLSAYAMNRIQSSAISDLVDPDLGFATDFKVRRMTSLVAELASQCLQHDRELRPSMEEILEILKNIASEDYDAIEAEEANRSTRTTHVPKPPPSPTDNDDVQLLRNTRQPPPSPISVMDKWLISTKSTTSNTSRSS